MQNVGKGLNTKVCISLLYILQTIMQILMNSFVFLRNADSRGYDLVI